MEKSASVGKNAAGRLRPLGHEGAARTEQTPVVDQMRRPKFIVFTRR